jgi:hypothetical protein
MKARLKALFVIALHTTVALLCMFFLWGWLTVSDLKVIVKEKNLDTYQVVDDLMTTDINMEKGVITIDSPDGTDAIDFTSVEVNWLALILRLTDSTLGFFDSGQRGIYDGIFKVCLFGAPK